MNFKSYISILLSYFPYCSVIPGILEYLKEQARKTETETDDNIVSVLEVTFRALFPDCFN